MRKKKEKFKKGMDEELREKEWGERRRKIKKGMDEELREKERQGGKSGVREKDGERNG